MGRCVSYSQYPGFLDTLLDEYWLTKNIAPLPKACNWAVGTFVFASFANYEFCLYRRRLEKSHMKRAVEIIDRKKAEKEAAAKARRDERRRLKEEADRKAEEAQKNSWKNWVKFW